MDMFHGVVCVLVGVVLLKYVLLKHASLMTVSGSRFLIINTFYGEGLIHSSVMIVILSLMDKYCSGTWTIFMAYTTRGVMKTWIKICNHNYISNANIHLGQAQSSAHATPG